MQDPESFNLFLRPNLILVHFVELEEWEGNVGVLTMQLNTNGMEMTQMLVLMESIGSVYYSILCLHLNNKLNY